MVSLLVHNFFVSQGDQSRNVPAKCLMYKQYYLYIDMVMVMSSLKEEMLSYEQAEHNNANTKYAIQK